MYLTPSGSVSIFEFCSVCASYLNSCLYLINHRNVLIKEIKYFFLLIVTKTSAICTILSIHISNLDLEGPKRVSKCILNRSSWNPKQGDISVTCYKYNPP